MSYEPTIGLEIHAELKTRTKMFCDSKNDPNEDRPNVNVCPVCMGHPGTLPTVNKEAVKAVIKIGLAVGGTIADFTEFDRKNYFYPDIPKGYQISQYQYPLVVGGVLNNVALTRVHLEEDTGTSFHEEGDYSLVNYNRAGVPLMELVTEPVIHSAKEAVGFAKELQLLLRYLGVSEANMEKGEMRVEANISINQKSLPAGKKNQNLGTKVEVKNLNSFKAVERAIEFEVVRQTIILERGEKVVQETRGFDEAKQETFSQRQKEDSDDYRYFPDPDIPKLKISEVPDFGLETIKKGIPELPGEKRERYRTAYGLNPQDTEIFVLYCPLGQFFEAVTGFLKDKSTTKLAANYIISDLLGLIKAGESSENDNQELGNSVKIQPRDFAELILMLTNNTISSRGAKDILKIMYENGGTPAILAKEKGLLQQSDEDSLKDAVLKIVEANPKVVADYRAGKEAALQFLVGQGMKETKGSANPAILKKVLVNMLDKS